ncbi:MAG TPA: 5'-3' exonuclease H3TH domain-containing protein, partial [Desulfomonilia bacterium]|nr:5'-3' exonuclease H3TH domain-containing protein [Desulfomonilia bacterium]
MKDKKEVFLIDGSSYIYRAFYAMRNLSTSKGMPTNAAYILARMLLKLIKDKKPEFMCFVRDARGPTKRHTMYEKYKATRQAMPEALQIQIPYILQIVEAFGIPTLMKEGQEADDLIAEAARRFKKDARVTIITGDKDLMQLVDEDVTVWDTLKDKVYDREGVHEKYGVYPEYMADLLAIMGDSSDNIPGVPGIGEKGALELVTKLGHVPEIIEHASKIENKRARAALEGNADMARLSLDLVRLDHDVAIDIDYGDMRMKAMDADRLSAIFKELEFRALQAELAADIPREKAVIEGRIEIACSVPVSGEAGFYVMNGACSAVTHGDATSVCLEESACLDPLMRRQARLAVHNAKEALVEAMLRGIETGSEIFDTMLAAYCIDAASGETSLEDLARSYLDRCIHRTKDLLGAG